MDVDADNLGLPGSERIDIIDVKKYELLPYHPLGNEKRKALGMKVDGFSVPSANDMKELEKYVFIR